MSLFSRLLLSSTSIFAQPYVRPLFGVAQAGPSVDVAPYLAASSGLSGRTLMIATTASIGIPTPSVTLTTLTLNGTNVLANATGTGPWFYAVPDGAATSNIAWTVTATNSEGSDTASGTETLAPNLQAPLVSASSVLSGRTLTIGVDGLTGLPAPTVSLSTLTLDGVDVSANATGTGPWYYTAPPSASGQNIEWTVTATNSQGSDTSSGTNAVAADTPDALTISSAGSVDDATPVVGETITITPGVAVAGAGGAVTYTERFRILRSGGTIQSINSSYTLLPEDAGVQIIAEWRAEEVGNGATAWQVVLDEVIASSATPPLLAASSSLSGRTLTISVDGVTGDPTPTVALTNLRLDGVDVSGAATGTGPWVYVVPNSVNPQSVLWGLTATNAAGTDVVSGSNTVSGIVVADGDVFFGAQTPVGKGATPLTAPNGDYGEFTVSNNMVFPRVSPLTTSQIINGIEVVVRPGNVRTVSGYAELVEARNSGLRGYTFELQPGYYDMRAYNTDVARFEANLTPVTFKSANPNNRAVLTGWDTHVNNTSTDLQLNSDGYAYVLQELSFVNPAPLLSRTSFSINGDSNITRRVDDIGAPTTNIVDFLNITNAAVVNSTINGSLPHAKDGGRAFYILNGLRYGTNCSAVDVDILNVESGIDVNKNGVEMIGGSIKGVHGDFISTSAGVVGLKCHHVHFESPGADAGYRHPDIAQSNGKTPGTSVRNVDFLGCTASFGNRGEVSQDRIFPNSKPDEHVYTDSQAFYDLRVSQNKEPFTTLIGSSLTVTDFNAYRDNRFVITTGNSVEIILPSAAASAQRTFVFQHASNDATNYGGSLTFTLNGSDTHVCGTVPPSTGNISQGRSFVSNGTSEWQMLEVGRGRFDFIVREDVTLDTYHAWQTKVTISTGVEDPMIPGYNTATQNRVVTLPPGFVDTNRAANDQNAAFYLSRIFPHTGTVTIQFSNGEQVSVGGAAATSSFTMSPGSGYIVRWNGTGWDAERGAPSLQGMFTNNCWEGNIRGCIFLAHGGNHYWPELEGVNEGMNLYNNAFLSYPIENHPTSPAPANARLNSPIDRGQRNLVGSTFQVFNGAQVTGNVQLGILTGDSLAPLLPLVAATTEAELRAQSRDEIFQFYRAQAGSTLDTNGVGAVGPTDTSGFYNPTTQAINASFGAPKLTSSLPSDGGTYPSDGVVQLTFDQFIQKGTGNVVFYDVTNSVTLQTIPITDAQFVVNGTDLVFTPTTPLTPGITAEIRIDAGAVMPLLYTAPHAGLASGDLRWTTQSSGQSVYETVDTNQAYLTRSGSISAKSAVNKVLIAFQLDRGGSPSGRYDLINMSQGTSARSRVEMIGTTLDFNGWAGGNVGFSATSAIPTNGTTPQLLVISVDTTQADVASGVKAYLNDTALAITPAGWVQNATFDASGINSTTLLSLPSQSRFYDGLIDFAYASFPTTLPDISQQSVRDQFQFLNMGADGSGPTGEVPEVYVRNLADWNAGTNSGSGGDFATTGTFTAV